MRKNDFWLTSLPLTSKALTVTTIGWNVYCPCSFYQKSEYLHVVNHSAFAKLRGINLTRYDIWIQTWPFTICMLVPYSSQSKFKNILYYCNSINTTLYIFYFDNSYVILNILT